MHDAETVAQYIFHSNRLDGITISEEATRKILADELDTGSSRVSGDDGREFEVEIVLGHERAFREMERIGLGQGPFAEKHVLSLHKTLTGELLLSAGEYRECTLRYKGLLIASPPQHIAHRVDWLVKLINKGLEEAGDANKFSWRVHHEFVTLHPFIEANGRMARLLLSLIRLRRGLDLCVVPFDSREEYSRAIIEFQKKKIERYQRKRMGAPAD